uniref:Uncharacterized protein n=1 Tax=Micrurus lemniscatus lemniscatus TaxID=129467 RepID=A0A2D4JQK3_MICLE
MLRVAKSASLGFPACKGRLLLRTFWSPEKMADIPEDSVKWHLFTRKRDVTYRIPALIYRPAETTFLAFVEERSSPRDEHAKGLVMRCGFKEGLSVKWGPFIHLKTAGLPNHRTMNPCPVYDKKNDVIFLFFICVRDGISEQHQLRTGRNAVRLGYVSLNKGALQILKVVLCLALDWEGPTGRSLCHILCIKLLAFNYNRITELERSSEVFQSCRRS